MSQAGDMEAWLTDELIDARSDLVKAIDSELERLTLYRQNILAGGSPFYTPSGDDTIRLLSDRVLILRNVLLRWRTT